MVRRPVKPPACSWSARPALPLPRHTGTSMPPGWQSTGSTQWLRAGRQAQESRHVGWASLLGWVAGRDVLCSNGGRGSGRQRQAAAGSGRPPPDSNPIKIVRNALPMKDWTLQAGRQSGRQSGNDGCENTEPQPQDRADLQQQRSRLTPQCQPTRGSGPGKKV